MRRVFRLSGTLCLLGAALSSSLYAASGPGKNERGLSPGPPGGFLDDDYRVELMWIREDGIYGAGEYGRWLKHGGRDRYYQFHVPSTYKRGQPTPVVLVLHGGGGNPNVARFQSGMDAIADRENFIALYPAATHATYKDRLLYWNSGLIPKDARQKDIDDVAFIAAVLDDLSKYFTVDAKRVYATGISNGAHMSYRLVTQLPERIAAISPVAAQRAVGEYYAAPVKPVSMIYFHGKRDGYLPYNGGPTFKSAFEDVTYKSAQECILTWVKQDGCDLKVVETGTQGMAHMQRWSKCKDGSEVVFWTLEDGGHTWPGGKATRLEIKGGLGFNKRSVGPINMDISASQLMWEFFKRHPLK